MKDVINVGVIGFGIVGAGTVKILLDNQDSIAQKVGSRICVKKIADLDITTPRPVEVDKSVLTTDANELLDDPEIDIVVETIGGIHPAKDFILRALANGKSVATANKELIAKEGVDILPKAAELGLDFMFEASVGGGIPIIRPLKACLAGNQILEVKGIVNGTTNYILTKMREEGLDFADVLKDAQSKGYAEADPTADIEGNDAAYKTSILASIAFTSRMDVSKVYREGITKISAEDMNYAEQLGYVIKLLGIAKQEDHGMLARVHPTFVPAKHPLASVNGVMNAIWVKGDAVGEVMFYGPGAGSLAAGSAVVGDVIDIARNINDGSTSHFHCTCYEHREMLGMEHVSCKNYVRILAKDKPRVLASIASKLADHKVSISSVIQNSRPDAKAEIVILTHTAKEPDMADALEAIRNLPVVTEICSWIRVEE